MQPNGAQRRTINNDPEVTARSTTTDYWDQQQSTANITSDPPPRSSLSHVRDQRATATELSFIGAKGGSSEPNDDHQSQKISNHWSITIIKAEFDKKEKEGREGGWVRPTAKEEEADVTAGSSCSSRRTSQAAASYGATERGTEFCEGAYRGRKPTAAARAGGRLAKNGKDGLGSGKIGPMWMLLPGKCKILHLQSARWEYFVELSLLKIFGRQRDLEYFTCANFRTCIVQKKNLHEKKLGTNRRHCEVGLAQKGCSNLCPRQVQNFARY